ncbi:outer membrane beta-barrel protein [Thalassotalea fonticola]|uniref:Outer membrane beta-barrel protein n=1 Tax=Thalassotalea fonticola TaxID=3065649 RepID=A0ABZ0GSM1_9GAMM|nr:outer membrane beta-barrel protein [Colwelliaceae bacterium S1-1]
MKVTNLLLCLSLIGIYSSHVNAADYDIGFQPNQQYYFGASIGHGVHVEDSLEEFGLSALVARLGYNHSKNLAFEFRVGAGLAEDEIDTLKRELNYLLGLYAVYTYNINNKFNIYGVAGFSSAEIDSASGASRSTYTETSPSLGGGVEYKVNRRASWLLEGMAYVEGDANYGVLSFGFKVNF